ncbi:MAG TPA: BTAD domain-containing putative transcriptional regulator, partial [Trueperaceae bacterium]
MPGACSVEFVRLTGRPAASTGLDETSFLPDKRFQLLAYLAYDAGWVGRERAAFLFWPDSDTSTSRQNLRGLLKRVRGLPFPPEIEVTPHQLRWRVPTDVEELKQAIAAGDAARAMAAYRGPLLDGLEGDEEDEYAEWLTIEREQLHSRWRGLVLGALLEPGLRDGSEATRLFERLVGADPLDEEAVRVYMHAMTRLGRPTEALRAYRDLKSRLDRDLGLEPTSDTAKAAANAEAAAATEPLATQPAVTETSDDPPSRFTTETATGTAGTPTSRGFRRPPTPKSSFVGREAELANIAKRLLDPSCRFLTLLGPGGVGKTRLALAAAERLKDEFAEGVVYVGLETLASAQEVGPAIAGALGLTQAPGSDPLQSVEQTLAGAQVLMVLDNFEHVLDAASLLPGLLAAAPGLKLLVTSRERIGLEAEWTFTVDGLDYPTDTVAHEELPAFGTARLLLERAGRVRPGFRLENEELPTLMRLFELTAGMPLAIELTAVWLRAVPLASLVTELEEDPGSLTTADADKTTRHESIRAVFEQSWARLTDSEQAVMRRLAAFAANVSPEAAAYVAGANRAVLGSLVDKSLLRLGEDGRYARHPLVRALTSEKLAVDAAEQQGVWTRHAAYYLRFLRERTDRAKGSRTASVQQELRSELPELKVAMRRAAEREPKEDLVRFMELLELELGYFQAHGHDDETLGLLESAALAAEAAGELDSARDLRGRVGDSYWLHRGDPQRALTEYRKAIDLAHRSGNRAREAVLSSLCGAAALALDAEGAQDQLDAAMELATESADPLSLSTVLEHHAYTMAVGGDTEGAREQYVRSIQVIEQPEALGVVHPFEVVKRRYFATLNLGNLERMAGNGDAALEAKQRALAIASDVGNPIWQAHVHLELGEMYGAAGRYE